MRTDYVETYETSPGSWHAVTVDRYTTWHTYGTTEVDALAKLCEELLIELDPDVPGIRTRQ